MMIHMLLGIPRITRQCANDVVVNNILSTEAVVHLAQDRQVLLLLPHRGNGMRFFNAIVYNIQTERLETVRIFPHQELVVMQ